MKKHKLQLNVVTKQDPTDKSDYILQVTQNQKNPYITKVKMTYGYDSDWLEKGKGSKTASLTDNGDNIVISMRDLKKRIKLEYYEFNQLYGLMKYYIEHSELEPDGVQFIFNKLIK